MSGRARIYQGRHYAYIYWTGEPLQVARFEQGGRWKPVCMDGPTFKRRADAKRWLIARAAGLAEVPQSESVPAILITNLGDDVPRPPRGWRIARQRHDVQRGNGDVVVTVYERNRRRR